jgi:hypothetical protein
MIDLTALRLDRLVGSAGEGRLNVFMNPRGGTSGGTSRLQWPLFRSRGSRVYLTQRHFSGALICEMFPMDQSSLNLWNMICILLVG